ncbi:hypothetical protein ACROYT_G039557 [Oculina patagonica]
MLITNRVRNVTPAPMPPNVSDKNQKIQAFDGEAFLYPTLTMKLVCDNKPTKISDDDNEQSKVCFGDCRSDGVRKIAHRTSRLEEIVVIEEIPFAMRRKMEKSMVYQEITACTSINEHNCSRGTEVEISVEVGTNVWPHRSVMYLAKNTQVTGFSLTTFS